MSDRTYLVDHTSERYILFSKGSQGGQYLWSGDLLDSFLDQVIFHSKLDIIHDNDDKFDDIYKNYENYSQSREYKELNK